MRKLPGNVVPAHVRQIEIHEQDRGYELDSESKSGRARMRDACITVPRRLQQGGESIGGKLISAPQSGRFSPEGVKPGTESFLMARANVAEPLSIPASKVIALRLAMPIRNMGG